MKITEIIYIGRCNNLMSDYCWYEIIFTQSTEVRSIDITERIVMKPHSAKTLANSLGIDITY